MPADSSFDIVSKLDRQEVDNALNQAGKEISTRFDFRNVGASIAWSGDHGVEIRANSEERAKAVLDVFKDKLVKRGVSLKVLDASDPKLSGKEYRLSIALKEGITQDDAKKIAKIIRDDGPKGIKAQVQGDELRVSSKKKDDLQSVIALLKGKDFDFAVQVHQLPLSAPGRRPPASWRTRPGQPGGIRSARVTRQALQPVDPLPGRRVRGEQPGESRAAERVDDHEVARRRQGPGREQRQLHRPRLNLAQRPGQRQRVPGQLGPQRVGRELPGPAYRQLQQ